MQPTTSWLENWQIVAHPAMLNLRAHFYLGSLVLLTVQSSMGLTQPSWTYHTLLSPLILAQQGTLSVWYWGRDWTPQLCTTTLCLQLVEMWLWECKGPSQRNRIVSMKLCVCANKFMVTTHWYGHVVELLSFMHTGWLTIACPCICTPKLNSDVILNVVFTMARPPGHKIVVYRNGTSTAKVFSVVLRTVYYRKWLWWELHPVCLIDIPIS